MSKKRNQNSRSEPRKVPKRRERKASKESELNEEDDDNGCNCSWIIVLVVLAAIFYYWGSGTSITNAPPNNTDDFRREGFQNRKAAAAGPVSSSPRLRSRFENEDLLPDPAALRKYAKRISLLIEKWEKQEDNIVNKNWAQQEASQLDVDVIKTLVENGTDLFRKNDDDLTLFHQLLPSHRKPTPIQFHSITKYLIDKNLGKLFNTPGGKLGSTPFHWVVYNLEVDQNTLSLLHDNGVNFNQLNQEGDSLLSFAVMGGRSPDFLSNLIKLGSDWKVINRKGRTLLHIAASEDNLQALKFLLDLGLFVNELDMNGDTPLHLVAQFWTEHLLEAVALLVEHGADIGLANNFGRGKTPLDYVEEKDPMPYEKDKIVQLLTSRGGIIQWLLPNTLFKFSVWVIIGLGILYLFLLLFTTWILDNAEQIEEESGPTDTIVIVLIAGAVRFVLLLPYCLVVGTIQIVWGKVLGLFGIEVVEDTDNVDEEEEEEEEYWN